MSEMKSDKSQEPAKKLDDDFMFYYKNAKKPSIIHIIFLNRTLRILPTLAIFCMLIPIAGYFYFYSTEIAEYQIDDSGICSHYPIYQIPCGDENTTESSCIANACCYSTKTGCYHFLPSKYQLRTEKNRPVSSSDKYFIPTIGISPLRTVAISKMEFDIQELSAESLLISLWNPEDVSRIQIENSSFKNSKYGYKVFSPELYVEVWRKSNNKTILSTARGPLIASKNYFEWTLHLNTMQLMGFDELSLKEGHRILINNEHTSAIPYVVAFDHESKHYHAVHFASIDSPAEIQILKSNVIIIRQFHSSSFQIHLHTGPTYDDIYRQINEGISHYVPSEYWALGVHLCQSHDMYNETETQIELNRLLMDENLKSLPFDSHCIDAELTALIMSQNETEYFLNGYEEVVEMIKMHNKKLLLHISMSAIQENSNNSLGNALDDDDFFLKQPDGSKFATIYGKTRKVSYLDYITKSQKIIEILKEKWLELFDFHNLTDGIFLHKSYLPDDTVNKSIDYLKGFNFKPNEFENSIEHIVPLNLKLSNGTSLIDQLNNYARRQMEVFEILNDDKKFCVSDSFREDSASCALLFNEPKPSWITFKRIVHKSVFYSSIGLTFYGAGICGSNDGKVAEDLCIRWYQFSIFMPLFYVKSDKAPPKFSKYGERIMVQAVRVRYSLLPYMKMQMILRKPILRPLHFVYPELGSDVLEFEHFMLGDSLLISPVMEPLIVEKKLQFPEKYYEFWSGLEMATNTTHFSTVMSDIPIFIRSGHIVATNIAHNSLTAEEARLQPFQVIVALSCSERFSCSANGKLLIETDLEFNFTASENFLNITVITTNPSETRLALCGPERFASSEFQLAKIYGLGDFKAQYRNDYLSLNLNICQHSEWNETFSFSI